jgi:proline dehydrogenase
VDAGVAFGHASALAQAARDAGLELMISMEGSERTAAILALHRRLCERFDNVGITLQANLYRTEDDMAAALARPGRIRLVKGAYEEPADVARTRGLAVDAACRDLMHALLASGHACSIATHDPALLGQAHAFIQEHGPNGQAVEFEMLYGITPERLQAMRDRGYRTRIYLPYGRAWYLYLCHRLAEYPPNIYQAIVDAVAIAGRPL